MRDSNKSQKRSKMHIVKVLAGVLLFGFYSCNTKKEVVVVDNHQEQINKLNHYIMALSTKVDSLEKIIEENQRKSLIAEHDSLIFSLERTPCLGTCPVFKLEVFSDGYVKYHGRNYVDLIGDYAGTLKPEQLKQVVNLFNQADFYAFEDSYNDGRLDLPATIIEYNSKKGYKKVNASTEIPRNFRVLASELEVMIKDIDWALTDY